MKQSLCPFLLLLQATSLPGAPSNTPAALQAAENGFILEYDGARILEASSSAPLTFTATTSDGERIEQRLRVAGQGRGPVTLKLTVTASEQTIAAEAEGAAQQAFPMVRTTHGPSHKLRNNAVYDRFGDWMLEFPAQGTRIIPDTTLDGGTRFEIGIRGDSPEIIFRPRFYQKHRNIRHFEPWKYKVRRDSIAGCSRVVAGDRYVLTLNVPEEFSIHSASFDWQTAEVARVGATARLAFLPQATESVSWSIHFQRQALDPRDHDS